MSFFERDLPFRALLLWCILVPSLMGVGLAVGSWLLPATLAIIHDGFSGLLKVPTEHHVFAHPPSWVRPSRDAQARNIIEIADGILALAGAAMLGIRAHRLWQYLALKKLRWMTKEQLERFNNKQQWM